MGTWKGIIGASFTPAAFDQCCHLLHGMAWRPSFIVLYNTGVPAFAALSAAFQQKLALLDGAARPLFRRAPPKIRAPPPWP